MNAPFTGAHVLLIDPDQLVLALVGHGLRRAGYRVSCAGDAFTAIKILEQDVPDLALVDLPALSGAMTARTFVERRVPFIVFSTRGGPDALARGSDLGALAYLVKPLDIPQIVPQLETSLARVTQIRSLEQKCEHLNHALVGSRDISIAVGILMERFALEKEQAFEIMRSFARSRRCPLAEVAGEIVGAVSTLNHTNQALLALRAR